jgi:hypothetical protein
MMTKTPCQQKLETAIRIIKSQHQLALTLMQVCRKQAPEDATMNPAYWAGSARSLSEFYDQAIAELTNDNETPAESLQ